MRLVVFFEQSIAFILSKFFSVSLMPHPLAFYAHVSSLHPQVRHGRIGLVV